MHTLSVALIVIAFLSAGFAAAAEPQPAAKLSPVPFTSVHLEDAFWAPRIKVNIEKTVPHNFKFCESTGRISNFVKAAGQMPGNHQGIYFDDSDLYKAIEAAAYNLAHQRNPEFEKYVDSVIDKIAAAQQPDGYLYTYYTVRKELDKRWSNTKDMHEMYCAGHLIEGACAYYQATGKRKLLDVAIKLANHIDSVFGPDKRHDVCGHEEIELALVKLSRITGDPRYLKLATFFVDERGRDCGRKKFGEYAQDDIPLRDRREIAGHAVRAMYFFTAAADVASANNDPSLIKALDTIWHDVVDRKMYITGGIGPSSHNEGFTVAYDLPNDSAYAETCASVGMVLWNHRMTLLHADAKYADVMERCLYNNPLSGISLDGTRFFYVNPLGSKGKHHRVDWFGCACCPPNIARLLPSVGGYMYATTGNALYVNLYAQSRSALSLADNKISIAQDTRYPWDGAIKLTVTPEKPANFALNLRIPGWCKAATLKINGQAIASRQNPNGYASISRDWKAGDTIDLDLPMPVERVYADPNVKADVGRVCLQRGPIVYCLEGADNDSHVRNLSLPKDSKLTAEFRPDLLNGVTVLKGSAIPRVNGNATPAPVQFTAVPYYAWDNREPGQMVVWIPEDPKLAEPLASPSIASQSKTSASHTWQLDAIDALNDQNDPARSNDQAVPRFSWWDHKGTTEWVQYDFKSPSRISAVEVYWFDDTGAGSCRVPKSWRLLYKDGEAWKPVANASQYPAKLNAFNRVTFNPITTPALRLEAQLQSDFSAGILEWRVME